MTVFLVCALVGVLGYLLGSINFAVVVSKVGYGQDVRQYGSGNAGMTNVLRTYGKKAAIFTLLGDFCKGMAAVFLARFLFYLFGVTALDGAYIAGGCAILGHLYPVFFGFRGGKGILTTIGVISVINLPVFLALIAICVPVIFITKTVSIGSLLGAVLFPLFTYVFGLIRHNSNLWDLCFSGAIGVLVIWMHRGNIKRLLNGTENKFGAKKQKQEE